MKTFVLKKTGQRFPEYGCNTHLWQKPNGRFELFIRGQGTRKVSAKAITLKEIEDLPENFSDDEFREYAAKYGTECAQQFLSCADICKPTLARRIITRHDPGYPSDENRAWFKSVFEIDPINLSDRRLLALADTYSFDMIEFENRLAKRFRGYRKDRDGSIRDFIISQWGPDVCSRFERVFLKSQEATI